MEVLDTIDYRGYRIDVVVDDSAPSPFTEYDWQPSRQRAGLQVYSLGSVRRSMFEFLAGEDYRKIRDQDTKAS